MTQFDHLIEAVVKEIGRVEHMGINNSQKTDPIEYQPEIFQN
jgi:hypothetical protein